MTVSLASALIVSGPSRLARIENWVASTPLGAKN
jgi:hypothetical protein